MPAKKKTALVFGATGLIGRHLIDFLLADESYSRVNAVVRKSIGLINDKLHEIVAELDNLQDSMTDVKPDHVFCCLGTTLKKAGSKEAFRKVDFDYILNAARIAVSKSADGFAVISSLGASKDSKVFYNRVKGETEFALQKLQLPKLIIIRPSLLLGDRIESRPGEKIGEFFLRIVSPFLIGKLRKYRAVQARQVALAMLKIMKSTSAGLQIIESDEITKFSDLS